MSEYLSAIAILMLVLSPLIIPIAITVMHGLARRVPMARAAVRIRMVELTQTMSRNHRRPVATSVEPGHVPLGGTLAQHTREPQGAMDISGNAAVVKKASECDVRPGQTLVVHS